MGSRSVGRWRCWSVYWHIVYVMDIMKTNPMLQCYGRLGVDDRGKESGLGPGEKVRVGSGSEGSWRREVVAVGERVEDEGGRPVQQKGLVGRL